MELSGSDLILLHLMKVLQGYTCCLPALCSEARFNAWQLLPQVRTGRPMRLGFPKCLMS